MSETPPAAPRRDPLWLRIPRMPLFWALACGVLAAPGYLQGDGGFFSFLMTLVGGALVGISFVNATYRLPLREGMILHVLVSVGLGALLYLMIEVVPGLLAPKPNPARALLAVLQMALVPAAGWIWVQLIGRITGLMRIREARIAPPPREWEAEGRRGSVLRFAAVPLTMRSLTVSIVVVVVSVAAIGVLILIALGDVAARFGPRTVVVFFGLVLGFPAYLVYAAVVRRRTVSCTVGFDDQRLRVEAGEEVHVIRYAEIEHLVWGGDGEYARIEVRAPGTDLSLIAGMAAVPKGESTQLPPLSRRVLHLLDEAGLVETKRRRNAPSTFHRPEGPRPASGAG